MKADQILKLAKAKHAGTMVAGLAVLIVYTLEQAGVVTDVSLLIYGAAVLFLVGLVNHIDAAFFDDAPDDQ